MVRLNLRLMKIHMERLPNKKVVVVLIVLSLLLLHFYAHRFEYASEMLRDDSDQIEWAKKYEPPSFSKVKVIQDANWEAVRRRNEAAKSKLCFVFMVERTEGYSYRAEMRSQLAQFTDCVIFLQICNVVDKLEDENTVFIQSGNLYNPWVLILKLVQDKLIDLTSDFHQFIVAVSSKVHLNVENYQSFERFLFEELAGDIIHARRVSKAVERNPIKSEYVPEFLYPEPKYPKNSPSDEFLAIPVSFWSEGSQQFLEFDQSYLPLGVFAYKLLERYYPESLIDLHEFALPKFQVSKRKEVGYNLCKFKSNFATVGFNSQEEIRTILDSEPYYGYFCVPYFNYHINYTTLAITLALPCICCCLQCAIFALINLGTPSKDN